MELTPYSSVVPLDVPELDVSMADEDQDAISIAASWEGSSLHQEEEEGQPFPVFRDFLEKVLSTWSHLASAPNVQKRAVPLASLVPDEDEDKALLLDALISHGYTFGSAVEEILQHSHREHEASQQIASMLHSRASVDSETLVPSHDTHGDSDGPDPHCSPLEASPWLSRQLKARTTCNDGRMPGMGSHQGGVLIKVFFGAEEGGINSACGVVSEIAGSDGKPPTCTHIMFTETYHNNCVRRQTDPSQHTLFGWTEIAIAEGKFGTVLLTSKQQD
ncbi:UNVERIFIED_CONTAM: hypothetical protein FKN15_019432 [Acipenser sinensis]